MAPAHKFKPVQILFFVDGVAPTSDDIIAAASFNAHVMFRNARAVPAEGCLELCDGVAGKVPPRYAKAYPAAEAAIEKRTEQIKALADKVGDSPAPESPQPSATAAGEAPAPQSDAKPSGSEGAANGAGEAAAIDAANQVAPGAAPIGAAGKAWKSN